jgi:hypothetical protein
MEALYKRAGLPVPGPFEDETHESVPGAKPNGGSKGRGKKFTPQEPTFDDSRTVKSCAAPPVNVEFLSKLSKCKGSVDATVGSISLAEFFTAAVVVGRTIRKCFYEECEMAAVLQKKLRLHALQSRDVKHVWLKVPLYNLCRIVRYAAFTGVPSVTEIDLCSSHPRQIMKYAIKHSLPNKVLKSAFGTRASMSSFRELPCFVELGLSKEAVKLAANSLCYGSSGADWCKEHHLPELPDLLDSLRLEVREVVNHLWKNSSEDTRLLLSERERPQLTLLSVMCQETERIELDLAVKHLPSTVEVRGYLCDAILVHSDHKWDIESYLSTLESLDVIAAEKKFHSNPQEYLDWYKAFTGGPLDTTPLSEREVRRMEAKAYAEKYLFGGKNSMAHRPDLEFAIAIESEIPIYNNPITGKTEVWDPKLGRWLPDSTSSIKGEDISDPLRSTFKKIQMQYVDEEKSFKPTAMPFDDSMFANNSFLSTLAQQASCLKFGRDRPALDSSAEAARIRVFQYGLCLDFNIKLKVGMDPQSLTVDDLMCVLRPSHKDDRISRTCPSAWKEYINDHKMELFHVLRRVEMYLDENDLISDELKAELNEQAKHHNCLRQIFYEAHSDWDEAIFCMKILCNCVNGKSYGRCEHYTMWDEGHGSTSKGPMFQQFIFF